MGEPWGILEMGEALRGGQIWTREREFIVLFRFKMLQWVPSEDSKLEKGFAILERSLMKRSGLEVKFQTEGYDWI